MSSSESEYVGSPKAKIILNFENIETGEVRATKLEFFNNDPDTIRDHVADSIRGILSDMGYLWRTKENT